MTKTANDNFDDHLARIDDEMDRMLTHLLDNLQCHGEIYPEAIEECIEVGRQGRKHNQ